MRRPRLHQACLTPVNLRTKGNRTDEKHRESLPSSNRGHEEAPRRPGRLVYLHRGESLDTDRLAATLVAPARGFGVLRAGHFPTALPVHERLSDSHLCPVER